MALFKSSIRLGLIIAAQLEKKKSTDVITGRLQVTTPVSGWKTNRARLPSRCGL